MAQEDTLVLLAAAVALPLLLLTVRAIFVWRYRRTLQRSMGLTGDGPASAESAAGEATPAHGPLRVLQIRDANPQPLVGGARELAATATHVTRRVRTAFLVSVLALAVFAGAGVTTSFAPNIPPDARLAAVGMVLVSVLLILVSVLSLPRVHAIGAVVAYGLLGIAVTAAVAGPARAVVVISAQAQLFLLLPAAGVLLLLSRRLRPLLIALLAIAIYAAVSVAAGFSMAASGFDATGAPRWVWLVGVAYLLLGIVIVGWLLSRPERPWRALALIAAAGIVGAAIEWFWSPAFPIGALLLALPSNVGQLLAVWWVFRLAVWLQDRRLLAPQVVQAHIAYGFLTTYFVMLLVFARGSSLFGTTGRPIALIAIGFIAYIVILHVLLTPVWKAREHVPGMRLLFLRTFGQTRGPERLLDTLEDTWQRIGRIDLIAAADLAVRALGSRMIEAFLVRRVDAQFLRTADDVARRVGHLRGTIEGDARYPINDIYCHGDAWQHAVRRLAPESDAVLMDLRGFTRRNRGCVFELTELVRTVPRGRVVLLVDRTTDVAAADEIAATAWSQRVPADGLAPAPALTVLRVTGARRRDSEALFRLLLEAAVPDPV